MSGAVAAIDLGATSGRVMLGSVARNDLALRHVARFPNTPKRVQEGVDTGLHWDILDLYRNVLSGLTTAVREEPELASVAVDCWGVDYATLRGGRMVRDPYHYRDERSAQGVADVHSRVSPEELYVQNGLQFLPFNTLYQLTTDRLRCELDDVDEFLLVPDLISYWLTGRAVAERTEASTTGLLRLSAVAKTEGASGAGFSGAWNDALIAELDLRRTIFPELVDAGTSLGGLLPSVAAEIGSGGGLTATAVGSHDTASAVVAVPMDASRAAYISCGTWGLVGVEIERPVLTEESRLTGFTNEGGVDGRFCYMRNVMGMWLLSESVRAWQRRGPVDELSALLAQAAATTVRVSLFDVDDPRFFPPGDMPERIAQWCEEHGEAAPRTPAEFVRSIIESLAVAFAKAVRDASRLSGVVIETIHVVGGGSQNPLLCQLVADRSELPVLAGPTEATALGNVLVQARTAGFVSGTLESLRALVASTFSPRRYEPRAMNHPVPATSLHTEQPS